MHVWLFTLKNCSNFAKHIIDILREEEQRYKLGKNDNIPNTNNNNIDNTNSIEDTTLRKSSTTTPHLQKNRYFIFS